MSELRILIADDEPLVRRDLQRLLALHANVSVVGEARDGAEALTAIDELDPDVVFLDIQMPELDGFAVLAGLEHAQPHVVFVTAFDAYAARAFDIHAVDYLLKPFDPPRLDSAIARVRQRMQSTERDFAQEQVAALGSCMQARGEPLHRLAVRSRGRIRYLRTAEIDWVESADNYVIIHAGIERHTLRSTMQALEDALDPAAFARTHRSAIVRLDQVLEIEPLFKGDAVVILKSGARVPLSRGYRDEFRRRMQG